MSREQRRPVGSVVYRPQDNRWELRITTAPRDADGTRHRKSVYYLTEAAAREALALYRESGSLFQVDRIVQSLRPYIERQISEVVQAEPLSEGQRKSERRKVVKRIRSKLRRAIVYPNPLDKKRRYYDAGVIANILIEEFNEINE